MSVSNVTPFNPSIYLIDALNPINLLSPISSNSLSGLNGIFGSFDAQFSSLGQMMSAANTLELSALVLTQAATFSAQSATSSAPGILTGSAVGVAAGTYAVQVTQLAQAQTLQSTIVANQFAQNGKGDAATLTFQFVNGMTSTVDLGNGNHSLSDISTAINNTAIGVSASILTTASGVQLQLRGQSGRSNAFKVVVSGDAVLIKLFNSVAGDALPVNSAANLSAQDAQGTINGIEFSGSSNVVQTDIAGLSLNLVGIGVANLIVGPATGQLAAVQSFVDAFNRLQVSMQIIGQGVPTIGQFGFPFQAGSINPIKLDLSALAGIGITRNQDGSLSLNQPAFLTALAKNPASVANVFSNGGKGVADQILVQTENILSPVTISQLTASAISSELMLNELFMNQDINQTQTGNIFGSGVSSLSGFGASPFNGQLSNTNFTNPTSNSFLSGLLTQSSIYSLASLSAQFNFNNLF